MEEGWLGTKVIDPEKYKNFRKKWGIIMKALVIAVLLSLLKFYIDVNGLATIPMNALVTSVLAGVFFTIGILFAGAIADYKESERIPGELSASIRALYADAGVVPIDKKDEKIIAVMRMHIVELLSTLNSNFRRNVWKLKEISMAMDKINEDIRILAQKGVAPGFITKFRSELTVIDRLSHRIDTISETTFIPAAYTLAEVAIATILSILLFVDLKMGGAAIVVIGITSIILMSLVFLIKDVDSPFEVSQGSYADVDLSLLFNLEDYLSKTTPGMKTKAK